MVRMVVAVLVANTVFVASQYFVYQTGTHWGLIPIAVVAMITLAFSTLVYLLILRRGDLGWKYVNEKKIMRLMTSGWLLISCYIGWVGFQWYESLSDLLTVPIVLFLFVGVVLTSIAAFLLIESARTYHSNSPTLV